MMTGFAMEDMSVNGYLAKELLLSDSFDVKVFDDVNFNVLMIDADLFSWETPLEATYMEFKRLCNIEDGIFSYDLLMSYTED